MENPDTWGKLEHAIADELKLHAHSVEHNVVGLSLVRRIADRLRDEEFVKKNRYEVEVNFTVSAYDEDGAADRVRDLVESLDFPEDVFYTMYDECAKRVEPAEV